MAEDKQIPSFSFKGIPKIMIPITDSDIRYSKDYGRKLIAKYMPLILSKHQKNREKIQYCYEYALGQQDIYKKERLYNKDKKNNNRIVENHAFKHTRFKSAFITSQQRDYSHKIESDCDEIKCLHNYFSDVNFFSKDKNIKEWVYSTGVGVSYGCHRTDIVKKTPEGKFEFVTEEDGFDYKKNAPFEFDDLDPKDNFVVYSSVRGNKPLFCISLVAKEKPKEDGMIYTDSEFEYKLYIETRYARFTATCSSSFSDCKDLKREVVKTYFSIPMKEHCSNKERLGLVELNRELFNCLNILVSNVLDMTVDGANIILVFKNTDIKQQTIDDMSSKGAIILYDKQDNKNNSEAKLETVTIKIDYAGLNSFYEERLKQTYDIAGVPIATGETTSGGDTGQAKLLNNGWENAYMMAINDVTTFVECDNEVLKGLLGICKDIPDCPIKNLCASDIEIKYHINQSDNMLSKAQAISTLYGIKMPKEEILKATNLFGDVCSVSQKWEEHERELEKKEKSKLVADNNVGNNGGDNNVGTKTDGQDTNVPTNDNKDNNSKE